MVALLGAFGDALRGGQGVWAAHLGGFVAGLLLGLALRALGRARVAPGPMPLASCM